MRISDWSSDVCSSDLFDFALAQALEKAHFKVIVALAERFLPFAVELGIGPAQLVSARRADLHLARGGRDVGRGGEFSKERFAPLARGCGLGGRAIDREGVVEGRGGAGRVDIGG